MQRAVAASARRNGQAKRVRRVKRAAKRHKQSKEVRAGTQRVRTRPPKDQSNENKKGVRTRTNRRRHPAQQWAAKGHETERVRKECPRTDTGSRFTGVRG